MSREMLRPSALFSTSVASEALTSLSTFSPQLELGPSVITFSGKVPTVYSH